MPRVPSTGGVIHGKSPHPVMFAVLTLCASKHIGSSFAQKRNKIRMLQPFWRMNDE